MGGRPVVVGGAVRAAGTVSRADAGRLARAQGVAWERQVTADLEAARLRGHMTAWWRLTEETARTRGGVVAVDGGGGLPDYLALGPVWTWALEIKHTVSPRWSLDSVGPSQALHLTEWMSPPHRRSGVVLATHPPIAGRMAILLDWADLGPVWALWRNGGGTASLTVADALDMGRVWRAEDLAL